MGTKELKSCNEKFCKVNVNHKLYGEQVITATIQVIDEEKRLGVRIGEHELYVFREEIKEIKAIKNGIYIIGDPMSMKITIL